MYIDILNKKEEEEKGLKWNLNSTRSNIDPNAEEVDAKDMNPELFELKRDFFNVFEG